MSSSPPSSPSSARRASNAFRPESPHPSDAFTMVRFSTKIPRVAARGESFSESPIESVESSSSSPNELLDHHPHQLQPFELCFHQHFVTDPDQPISLHFDTHHASGSIVIKQYDHPLIVPRPSPPFCIHEIPDILDLTLPDPVHDGHDYDHHNHDDHAAATDAYPPPPPPPPPFPHTASSWHPLLTAALILTTTSTVALVLVLLLFAPTSTAPDPDLDPTAAAAGPCSSSSVVGPDGTSYVLRHTSTTEPASLYAHALPLYHRSISVAESLLQLLTPAADDWFSFLTQLHAVVHETCIHANGVLAPPHPHSDKDADALNFSCDLVLQRAASATNLWFELRLLILDVWLPSTMHSLRYTTLRLNMVPPRTDSEPWHAGQGPLPVHAAALVDAYQSLLGSTTAAPSWLSSCMLYYRDDPPIPWHFAYQPQFIQASRENKTNDAVSHLHDWAVARIAYRHELVSNPPSDVDGEPLYPNNQHPFEADDVVLLTLPAEDSMVAFTRHVTELCAGLDDLSRRLSRYGLGLGPDLVAGAPPPSAATTTTTTTTVPISTSSAVWRSWLGSIGRVFSGDGDTEKLQRRNNKHFFGTIDRARLGELAFALGKASADMLSVCDGVDRFGSHLHTLRDRENWATTNASYKPPGSNKTATIDVFNTLFTPNPAQEAQMIEEAYSSILSTSILIQQRQPSTTSPPTKETPPPTAPSKEEEEFLKRLKNGILYNRPLSDVVEAMGPPHSTGPRTTVTTAGLLGDGV
ncbi:hypothetical protein LX32DRAFT_642338 [Colletotrichum zoysiae]|uniref:Uncharacterized protein n=1 Tax=Colletotrichum zoysiae TaxID=1216348 RepID=A0AAD9HDB7_9PEZI|nr:hypothetical protein LX32DRAFT_642338 [Colletotrichum zoysiae]